MFSLIYVVGSQLCLSRNLRTMMSWVLLLARTRRSAEHGGGVQPKKGATTTADSAWRTRR